MAIQINKTTKKPTQDLQKDQALSDAKAYFKTMKNVFGIKLAKWAFKKVTV